MTPAPRSDNVDASDGDGLWRRLRCYAASEARQNVASELGQSWCVECRTSGSDPVLWRRHDAIGDHVLHVGGPSAGAETLPTPTGQCAGMSEPDVAFQPREETRHARPRPMPEQAAGLEAKTSLARSPPPVYPTRSISTWICSIGSAAAVRTHSDRAQVMESVWQCACRRNGADLVLVDDVRGLHAGDLRDLDKALRPDALADLLAPHRIAYPTSTTITPIKTIHYPCSWQNSMQVPGSLSPLRGNTHVSILSPARQLVQVHHTLGFDEVAASLLAAQCDIYCASGS
eukprot:39514-Rhodomonas_salina.1